MHSVPRCKQRFARSPARLAGQPPLAGYFKGARNRIDESDGRLAQRRGQVGGGALSWQSGTDGTSRDERTLRRGRETQSRPIVDRLGCGREEYAISAGEGGWTHRGSSSQFASEMGVRI